jgi:hypothetical protein
VNLKDRTDELEETVRQLRALLRPLGSFPAHWRMSPLQGRLLAALCRSGELNIEAACAAAGRGGSELTSPEVVRQHISRMRSKLEPRGITIESAHGIGYYLDPDSLTKARIGFRPADRVE